MMALELLLTVCEAPGNMLKKQPDAAAAVFRCALGFLWDVQEDAAWDLGHAADGDADAGQGELFSAGMEALDRFATAIGGKVLAPLVFPALSEMLASGEWAARHAALCSLSQMAEGLADALRPQAAHLAGTICGRLADPHPRVRHAAVNALGQLCTDLSPEMQDGAHAIILPGLLGRMSAAEHPRVACHAANAVVNFAEGCEPEIMAAHADSLLRGLLPLLGGTPEMQEASLTAIASTADCCDAAFTAQYDAVMPQLVELLSSATAPQQRMLRCKAIECATLVGLAVGAQRFSAHGEAVVSVMVHLERNSASFEGDDPTPAYLLQAWARLCKCLGAGFSPYLPLVFPRLLSTASLPPDVRALGDSEDEDEGCEVIRMGGKVLSIRTSVLEEKANGVTMLCCLVESLNELLVDKLEELAKLDVPLLKFYLSEEVRSAAIGLAPLLVAAGRAATEKVRLSIRPSNHRALTPPRRACATPPGTARCSSRSGRRLWLRSRRSPTTTCCSPSWAHPPIWSASAGAV